MASNFYMRDIEEKIEEYEPLYSPRQKRKWDIAQTQWKELYSQMLNYHDSVLNIFGDHTDNMGFNIDMNPQLKEVNDYYNRLVEQGYVKEEHMRLTENKIRKMIRESLSNLPPGTTDRDIDDYFGGPDRPSENADVEDIIEELEETLEEYAEDLGYLQEYPHAQALRMTYESDTAFFDDLYDEIMFHRK